MGCFERKWEHHLMLWQYEKLDWLENEADASQTKSSDDYRWNGAVQG